MNNILKFLGNAAVMLFIFGVFYAMTITLPAYFGFENIDPAPMKYWHAVLYFAILAIFNAPIKYWSLKRISVWVNKQSMWFGYTEWLIYIVTILILAYTGDASA